MSVITMKQLLEAEHQRDDRRQRVGSYHRRILGKRNAVAAFKV